MKLVAVLLTCSVTFLSSLVAPAFAQARSDLSTPVNKWNTSLALTALSVGSDNSNSQGLGESAWGVELAANYYFSPLLVTTLGFGFVSVADNENFSQSVSGQFSSNVQTLESDVLSLPFFAEVSYRSLAINDNGYGYGVGAGVTQFFGTKREIGGCIDCRSDEISFDGGFYLTASAFYNLSNSSRLGLSARQYVSGDVNTGVLFWFEKN